jgi:hypothetical protein
MSSQIENSGLHSIKPSLQHYHDIEVLFVISHIVKTRVLSLSTNDHPILKALI